MGAKSGGEHHNAVKLREDKQAVLGHVRRGLDTKTAVQLVGKRPDVLKAWMKDARFAADLEQARADGELSLIHI